MAISSKLTFALAALAFAAGASTTALSAEIRVMCYQDGNECDVTKELAICVVCGNPANRSQRLVSSGERVVVGAAGAYEARCRKCHVQDPAEATPPQTLKLFED